LEKNSSCPLQVVFLVIWKPNGAMLYLPTRQPLQLHRIE
jgi:hypothetical protein